MPDQAAERYFRIRPAPRQRPMQPLSQHSKATDLNLAADHPLNDFALASPRPQVEFRTAPSDAAPRRTMKHDETCKNPTCPEKSADFLSPYRDRTCSLRRIALSAPGLLGRNPTQTDALEKRTKARVASNVVKHGIRHGLDRRPYLAQVCGLLQRVNCRSSVAQSHHDEATIGVQHRRRWISSRGFIEPPKGLDALPVAARI